MSRCSSLVSPFRPQLPLGHFDCATSVRFSWLWFCSSIIRCGDCARDPAVFVNYLRPSLHCPAEVQQARTTTETATATKNNNNRNRSSSSSNIGSSNTENKSSDDGSNISWHVIFVINNYFACRHKHKQKGLGGGRRERGREGKEAAQANIGRHWRASSVLHVLVAQMLLPLTLSPSPPPSFCLA